MPRALARRLRAPLGDGRDAPLALLLGEDFLVDLFGVHEA
jgi:hypothetical protein